jgi:hypothetical protein
VVLVEAVGLLADKRLWWEILICPTPQQHYTQDSANREIEDKMVLAKSKTQVGLGNALMNDRFGHGKGADRRKGSAGIRRTGVNGETVCSIFTCIVPMWLIADVPL